MPRPAPVAIALLLAATLPAAAQEAEFFVSVGSFGSLEAAERVQAEAAVALAEPVRTLPADVAGRALFRVVGGPYGSRAAADARALAAQTSGYPGAWVVYAPAAGSAVAAAMPLGGPIAVEGFGAGVTELPALLEDDAALDIDLASLAGFDGLVDLAALGDLDDLADLPAAPPAAATPRQRSFIEPTEEPAWEAPPGFTLHRLPGGGQGADAATPSPSAPADADAEAGRTDGVMCKLVGWLPFAKSCAAR